MSAATLDQASLRQFPVGAGDCASSQAEIGSDLADRGSRWPACRSPVAM